MEDQLIGSQKNQIMIKKENHANVSSSVEGKTSNETSRFSKEQIELLQKNEQPQSLAIYQPTRATSMMAQRGSSSVALTTSRAHNELSIIDSAASAPTTGHATVLHDYRPPMGHSFVHIPNRSLSLL